MRLTDRSIRPMFPDGFRREVQVHNRAFGYDGENNADVLSMVAAFAALAISNLPFEFDMGAVRIGRFNGELKVFPLESERGEGSSLDLVVAGTADAICMVESSANQLSEADMLDALELGHQMIREIAELIGEFKKAAGREKDVFVPEEKDASVIAAVAAYEGRLKEALQTQGKKATEEAVDAVKAACVAELTAGFEDEALEVRTKAVKGALYALNTAVERRLIVDGTRSDGRKANEIRAISITPDFIKRNHGSVLFTRGETQGLVSTTLGTPDDEMIIDGIDEEYKKNFYLHY